MVFMYIEMYYVYTQKVAGRVRSVGFGYVRHVETRVAHHMTFVY